jgi:hypothetical protein
MDACNASFSWARLSCQKPNLSVTAVAIVAAKVISQKRLFKVFKLTR